MSTTHVAPAVNTAPSPAPSTSRATSRPGYAGRNEVQRARERDEQRAADHHDPAAAPVGDSPGHRAPDDGRERERARDHPDPYVARRERSVHVAREHRQNAADGQEREQRRGEDARKRSEGTRRRTL
jgi:hypothetical protein